MPESSRFALRSPSPPPAASSGSCSRILGSTASTADPIVRVYSGAQSDAIAAHTVFLETPSFLAIALIGNPLLDADQCFTGPDIPDLPRVGCRSYRRDSPSNGVECSLVPKAMFSGLALRCYRSTA